MQKLETVDRSPRGMRFPLLKCGLNGRIAPLEHVELKGDLIWILSPERSAIVGDHTLGV